MLFLIGKFSSNWEIQDWGERLLWGKWKFLCDGAFYMRPIYLVSSDSAESNVKFEKFRNSPFKLEYHEKFIKIYISNTSLVISSFISGKQIIYLHFMYM